ncbi:MAG: hypothetical protein KKA54_10735 [Proteobacteria bacterium]|nr:hypothetical protein [Pseudomonadota bacterium]
MKIGKSGDSKLNYHGNVFISGLTASGKTTHSYILAGTYGLTYVSGSQIHLMNNGMSPIQVRKFWVTDEGKRLLTENQIEDVDKELLRIEKNNTGCIFDTWIMPWIKSSDGISIYIMSSLESRTIKAAVSRRENDFIIDESYKNEIRYKDRISINLHKKYYGIDIENDLSVFDVIIDISEFIKTPTFESSQSSIEKANSIIIAVVGYYFTGKKSYRMELEKHANEKYMLRNILL